MSYPRSQSRRDEARGREAADAYARLIAALGFARGVLRATYRSRQEAEQARARIVTLFEPLLDLAAADGDVLALVSEAYGTAVTALDAAILDLRPIVRVTTGEAMPVCLLAWQIYGDTERAAELFDLNGARCPEFMPTTLQAEAPVSRVPSDVD